MQSQGGAVEKGSLLLQQLLLLLLLLTWTLGTDRSGRPEEPRRNVLGLPHSTCHCSSNPCPCSMLLLLLLLPGMHVWGWCCRC